MEWDYSILSEAGHKIADVSKQLWNLTDTYSIDVLFLFWVKSIPVNIHKHFLSVSQLTQTVWLAWGHCLKIFDAAGEEIGTVKERVLTFLPKFEIYLGQL